jgi:hypothetical protein
MMIDYLKYYDLEKYLFSEVGPQFQKSGKLNHTDLFLVFIWKANRAKTRMREKLKAKTSTRRFQDAATEIATGLSNAASSKDRLAYLMSTWGMRLPMASAVLSVLYPDDFTVYDVRVCEILDRTCRDYSSFSEECWQEYLSYKRAVEESAPKELSLRDKDRYLWAKSFYEASKADAER